MFSTHKLNDKGFEKVKNFKGKMSEAVTICLDSLPDGREKAIFKTKIEEAMFFGTKAIAADPENHSEVIEY